MKRIILFAVLFLGAFSCATCQNIHKYGKELIKVRNKKQNIIEVPENKSYKEIFYIYPKDVSISQMKTGFFYKEDKKRFAKILSDKISLITNREFEYLTVKMINRRIAIVQKVKKN
jgi:cell division protein YceG involved in septum cleavage